MYISAEEDRGFRQAKKERRINTTIDAIHTSVYEGDIRRSPLYTELGALAALNAQLSKCGDSLVYAQQYVRGGIGGGEGVRASAADARNKLVDLAALCVLAIENLNLQQE